ncbi:MAG: NAD(P)-binding domain-containing protein, partial [Planctomycetes bacterium]|nr:NAD(P)-binding domain-containing protein [Planctomycetota bacterium]
MTTIAILGTGLLGSGFVENLLQKGHTVRVWNRTASKLEPLTDKGAIAAADPAAAVRGATHVHLVLSEDAAVDEVIAALRPGLGAGVPVIDHSTNLPQKVAQRFADLRAAGVHYVSAPVFMSPQNARDASGMMLLSGPTADCDALEPHLAAMTGKVLRCGERPDLAAAQKLSGNSMFFAMAAAMHDVLAIGRGCGIDDATMLGLYDVYPIGRSLPWIGARAAAAG